VSGTDPGQIVPGPTVSFGFNLGKVPDHGEDSDPILRDGPDLGLVGVFDGMGGAGGTVYETAGGSRSGAYLASRIARDVVEEHLLELVTPFRQLPGTQAAAVLHDALEAALQTELEALKAPTSRLRSRLLRALPTTMALGLLQRAERDRSRWICHVLWAGDSRVYAFTPRGMHQLSIDDLRDEGDAMANLQRDSVISNAISADTDFHINHRRVALDAPFFLVSATDGCFGYVPTPMHFEEMVLGTLARSTSEEDWSAALQAEIAAVTGDDASMALIAVGADLEALRRITAPRLAEVTEQYTTPMDALRDEVTRAERALDDLRARRASDLTDRWRRYRDGYEQLLHGSADPESEDDTDAPERRIWNPRKGISTGGAPGEMPNDRDGAVGDAELLGGSAAVQAGREDAR
jgi:serine/threonine protein phosphatase PrpC